MSPELKAAIAYHEAGHAVATVLAFERVRSPNLPPPPPIKHVSILEDAAGKWSGICFGPQVYTTQWPDTRIGGQWRDAMEWQLVIDAAGGIAEAIHRGERNKRDMMWFAIFNCGTDGDLENMEAILTDLRRLTGRRHTLQRFYERACVLLREHWAAVERIAAALIESDHVGGDRVCELVIRDDEEAPPRGSGDRGHDRTGPVLHDAVWATIAAPDVRCSRDE
jgi:hypothetical protein